MLTQENEAVQALVVYRDQKPAWVRYTAKYYRFVLSPTETIQFITVEATGQENAQGFHPLLTFFLHLPNQPLVARFTNIGPFPSVPVMPKPSFDVKASAIVTQPQATIVVEDETGSHTVQVTPGN